MFALGKEATVMTKPEQITAPVITSADLSEYGDAKTLSVLLAVNDDAKQADVWMRLNEAGPLYAHMEISINGSEWESLAKCLVSNVKVPQTIDLSDVSVPDFALIRLRAVLGAEDVTAFPVEAEWSEAVGVNLIPDNVTEIPSDVQTEREPESDTGMGAFSAENRKTCSVCHLCGQPFGICLFVLGGVVCAVLLVVICLAAALKAGKKNAIVVGNDGISGFESAVNAVSVLQVRYWSLMNLRRSCAAEAEMKKICLALQKASILSKITAKL